MTTETDNIPASVWANQVFDDADPRLLARFKVWLAQNQHVFQMFEHVAEETFIRKGLKRYRAGIIANVARWKHDIKKTGETFRVDNDFVAPLARLLVALRPEFQGFFDLRLMKRKRRSLPTVSIDPNNDKRQSKLPFSTAS